MSSHLSFRVEAVDLCGARAGFLTTSHGSVPTPLFMPVGTAASVKGVDIGRVAETGAGMLLANTYHLHLRPGEKIVEQAGGLAKFMGWSGPTLTDSGGFQVFSLAKQVRVSEEGAFFRSHLDGSAVHLTPELSMQIQEQLGADIAMQLDEVIALPAERSRVEGAMQRSLRWATRCVTAHVREDQALFGIVQGGLEPDLRQQSAEALCQMPFAGYAVGGLSVGEGPQAMVAALEATVPHLPSDKPRYLMVRSQFTRLYISRARPATQCLPCQRSATPGGGLSVPRLPAQSKLSPTPLYVRRDARAHIGIDPQPDILSAIGGNAARSDCSRSICRCLRSDPLALSVRLLPNTSAGDSIGLGFRPTIQQKLCRSWRSLARPLHLPFAAKPRRCANLLPSCWSPSLSRQCRHCFRSVFRKSFLQK